MDCESVSCARAALRHRSRFRKLRHPGRLRGRLRHPANLRPPLAPRAGSSKTASGSRSVAKSGQRRLASQFPAAKGLTNAAPPRKPLVESGTVPKGRKSKVRQRLSGDFKNFTLVRSPGRSAPTPQLNRIQIVHPPRRTLVPCNNQLKRPVISQRLAIARIGHNHRTFMKIRIHLGQR